MEILSMIIGQLIGGGLAVAIAAATLHSRITRKNKNTASDELPDAPKILITGYDKLLQTPYRIIEKTEPHFGQKSYDLEISNLKKKKWTLIYFGSDKSEFNERMINHKINQQRREQLFIHDELLTDLNYHEYIDIDDGEVPTPEDYSDHPFFPKKPAHESMPVTDDIPKIDAGVITAAKLQSGAVKINKHGQFEPADADAISKNTVESFMLPTINSPASNHDLKIWKEAHNFYYRWPEEYFAIVLLEKQYKLHNTLGETRVTFEEAKYYREKHAELTTAFFLKFMEDELREQI